jgi:DNA-binding NarL/FixJ family response regulator
MIRKGFSTPSPLADAPTTGESGPLTRRGCGMDKLTPKEQQIAILVAQGMTNKEIAQTMGSSPFTVRNQVKVIIRKLELKNRTQVAYLIGQHQNGNGATASLPPVQPL